MKKAEQMAAQALSREEIGERVGRITAATIEQDRQTAKMNKELDAIRAKYAERLEAAAADIASNAEIVEAWAQGHRDLFEKTRSIEFARGTIGFRLGNFKVVPKKGVTLKTITETLAKMPWAKPFVTREKVTTLNREAIIAARDTLTAEQCAKGGFSVEQDDNFYVEPKQDEPAAVA